MKYRALGNTGLTGLTVAFNSALATALTALDQSLGAEIIQFDTFSALQQILQNPGVYGFDNVTDACVENLSNGQCDPTRWVYWDGVHPTTATHALLGAELAAAVVPEPASLWLLVGAALGWIAVGGALRRGRSRARS